MALTRRQKQILDYLKEFIHQNGYAPSFAEISEEFGYTSLATVHEHLSNLEAKGYIRKSYRGSRSIELPLETEPAVVLPLLGTVAAGEPIETIETDDVLEVPAAMVPNRFRHYALRVSGNSMIDEQIRDGDHIVVRHGRTGYEGQTVVALVRGERATVKKLYHEPGNRVRLQPANEALDPIIVDAREVAVQGVVVGLIRSY